MIIHYCSVNIIHYFKFIIFIQSVLLLIIQFWWYYKYSDRSRDVTADIAAQTDNFNFFLETLKLKH